MAGTIKGITIALDADTSAFNKALRSIQTESKKLQSELKSVNSALELDPKNNDLIKQKQDLLTKSIEETKKAIDAMKSAKDKADTDMANGVEINQTQYRKLQREIVFTQEKLNSLNKESANLKNISLGDGISTANAKTSQLSGTLSKASNSAKDLKNSVGQVTNETGKYSTSVDKAEKQTTQFTNTAKNQFNSLLTVAKGVIAGYAGKTLVDYFIGSNDRMEQIFNSFEVQLKSAQSASSIVADITDMAARTPLETTQLAQQGQLLLSYGVAQDQIIDKMTQLGDAAQGNADKFNRVSLAYGQMVSKGKVTGEELLQMTEAGVPMLNALADSMGVTTAEVSKLIEKGQVGIPELNKALESMTTGSGQFAGMMEKQSQTLTGMLSTLKDEFTMFGREAGEKAFGQVKESLSGLLQMIDEAKNNGTLNEVAESIGNALNTLINAIIKVTQFAYENRNAIIALAAGYATFKVALNISNGVKDLSLALGVLTGATEAQTVAQTANNIAMAANPVGLVISGVSALIAVIAVYASTADSALQKLQKESEDTKQKISSIESELSQISQKITEIQSKGKLSIADEEEISRLQAQKKLLEENLAIEKERQEVIDKQKEEAAVDELTSKDGKGDKLVESIQNNLEMYKKAQKEVDDYTQKIIDARNSGDEETVKNLEENLKFYQGVVDSYKKQALDTQKDIETLMKDVKGLTDDGQKLKEKYAGVNDELTSLFNINITPNTTQSIATAGDYYEQSAREQAQRIQQSYEETSKANDDIFSAEWQKLKTAKDRQLITDEQYYSKGSALLKRYGKNTLSDYDRFYGSMKSYQESQNQKMIDAEKKAADETEKIYEDKFKEIKSDYENQAKEIENQVNALSDRLSSAELFTRETVGEDDNVLIQTNFKQKTEELNQYEELLKQIQQQGAGDVLTNKIEQLGVTDAIDYMQNLLKSDNVKQTMADMEAYYAKANEIAKAQFADESKALQEDVKSKITAIMVDMPDTARKNGYDTAIAFLEGLSNGLGNVNTNLIGSASNALNTPKQKSQNNSGLGATIIPQTGTQNIVVQLTLDGKVISETVIKNINQQSYNQGKSVIK